MRDQFNDLRMRMKEALDNLWSRISGKFDTVHGRVDDAEAHIDDVEGELNATKGRVTSVESRMTTAEGQITGLNTRVGDLEDAVDDLDGAMIKSITFNGTAVPKDAQGNVALQETDPTVPAWAKQVKAKTSDLTNDGDGSDNNSPFATQEYVRVNGGKIDEVQVNGTALPIVNKAVNVPVPTLISQLINDVGFTKDSIVQVDYGGQYISEIYPYLIDKIGNEEIRRFRANILRIGLLTNNEINVDVWGFIYRWDENNADDDIWFTMVCYEEYSGNACYYARVYSNARDYRREIVHVDTVFQFGSGGGGSGAVDTVTFNGVTYQPDATGNVSFGFTETDPTVPSWAKAAQKPSYTASEVGAKPTQTDVADPTASGTAAAFIDTISQNAQGVITATKKSVTPASIGAVAKSGDTMTGTLKVSKTKGTQQHIVAEATGYTNDDVLQCILMIGDGGENHGIYSYGYASGNTVTKSGKWMIFRNSSGDVIVNGNAATATGVKDAGNSARTITIRYGGDGAEATNWIPMYDSNGNLVPVATTNLGAKLGVRRVLVSASIGITASMSFDLSAYSRIECDFNAVGNRGHFVLQNKNEWYCLSFLTEGTATSNTLNMYSIRAKYTDNGITVNYCGFKNLSTGVWNDRIGNRGYTLRNIYGYV